MGVNTVIQKQIIVGPSDAEIESAVRRHCQWWADFEKTQRRLVMAGKILIVASVVALVIAVSFMLIGVTR